MMVRDGTIVIYEVPIKQSAPIKALDRLVAHHAEQAEEGMDLSLTQQQGTLHEDKDEIDNDKNLEHALIDSGDFSKIKSKKKKGKGAGDKPIRVNPMRASRSISK
ncbi:MAG: hypothetical protein Q8838_02455 [Candidatus Phytoplasma australasiaticum]|nr:hypothetical protein [Candidatus Phytoplasma australasiaticum]